MVFHEGGRGFARTRSKSPEPHPDAGSVDGSAARACSYCLVATKPPLMLGASNTPPTVFGLVPVAPWWRKAPLIYFVGITEAVFRPIFPVWIADFRLDAGDTGWALVATDDFELVESKPVRVAREEVQASYSTTTTYRRNHQAWFSTLTKAAYQWKCAFSGLPVRALLVGAHIVPDADGGPPSVRNGICMSALHHVAFDSHLISVDPDFRVHVSSRLREQHDGELLAELKGLDGKELGLPADRDDWPSRDFLERRFASFRDSSR